MTNVFKIFLFLYTVGDVKATISEYENSLIPPVFHLDDFDRCKTEKGTGLYCSVNIQLEPLEPSNRSETWKIIEKFKKLPRTYRHDYLRYGVCVQHSCKNADTDPANVGNYLKKELSECYTEKLESYGLKAIVDKMKCNNEQYPYTNVDYSVRLFFIAYALFVLSASSYERFLAKFKPKEEYDGFTRTSLGRSVCAFSIPKNWSRLNTPGNTRRTDEVASIQGIRVILMMLVLLVHSAMMEIRLPVINTWRLEEIDTTPKAGFVRNIVILVQVFFVISGWLLSYHFLKDYENVETVGFSKFALLVAKRYIRLTIPMMIVIAFQATSMARIAEGPMVDHLIGIEYRNCRKNWWTNLLHVNNYYNLSNHCMLHTYSVASDMQLYTVCLFFVWLTFNHRKYVKLAAGCGIVVGLLVSASSHYVGGTDSYNHYNQEALYDGLKDIKLENSNIYMGHNHLLSYVVGVIFGCLFYKYRGKPLISKKKTYVFLFYLQCFFLQYFLCHVCGYFSHAAGVSQSITTAYAIVTKTVVAFSSALFILGTTEKLGGFARAVCEWQPFRSLAKLSYCIFLVHLTVFTIKSSTSKAPVYVSPLNGLYRSLGDICFSLIVALPLHLGVELPVNILVDHFLPTKPQKSAALREKGKPDKFE